MRLLRPALLLGLAVVLSGCFYSRELAHLRHDLERAYPEARFDREVEVSLGPPALHTLGWLARRVPEDEAQQAANYLHEVKRIKVGVYKTRHLPPLDEVDLPRLRRFREDGWQVAVRAREPDEMVWVLYRERHDAVRDLYVLVLSDEELVVARVQGHLNHLLARVVEDHAPLRKLTRLEDR